MPAPIEVRIDEDVLARLPGLRVTALAFTDLRMAQPSPKIQVLRDRVIAAARDRLAAARDVRRIPTLAAFHRGFPDLARGGRKSWLDEAFRGISRRDPFPVVNDAVDVGRLLALHFAVPVSSLDLSRVSPPLLLRVAPSGMKVKVHGAGDFDASDLPVLADAGGPAASPIFDVARTMPSRQTKDLLLVVYDPGAEAPIDAADLRDRASNWLATLTGARPVGIATAP